FSLAEARVLYELGTRERPKAKEIAEELGLDAGYLSRILGKFERGGLLQREAPGQDNGAEDLLLTNKGKASFEMLDAISDKQAQPVLEQLPQGTRLRLIQTMSAIEDALTGQK